LQKKTRNHHIGPPSHETYDTYYQIYNSNSVNRPERHLDAPQTEPTRHELDAPFTLDELVEAINSLPNNRAAGPDGIPYLGYKSLLDNTPVLLCLLDGYNRSLDTGTIQPFIESILVAIPKPGTAQTRPLNLLNSSFKILEKLVLERCKKADMAVNRSQHGFLSGRNCLHALLILDLAIRDANATGRYLSISSYDVEKAFDRIPKAYLAARFKEVLFSQAPKLALLGASLLSTPVVALIGSEPLRLELKSGCCQGGILSPLGYIVANSGLGTLERSGYRLTNGPHVGLVMFADDTTTLAESETNRGSQSNIVKRHYTYWGGRLREDKEQSLLINASPVRPAPINCLGSTVSSRGVETLVSSCMFLEISGWIRPLCYVEVYN
jgi:hypothetical protein